VHMLRAYRYDRFHGLLRELGMTSLDKEPDHYGLSLILGGAEGSLWELTGMYASMARVLNRHGTLPGSRRYHSDDIHPPRFRAIQRTEAGPLRASAPLEAGAIWLAFQAMLEVYRPVDEANWELYEGAKKIAWKTGTSFGHRDAWAIGLTPKYAVGVWVGNASGEGRPGLTGVEAAAPLLFDVFSLLPDAPWFDRPTEELSQVPVCRNSGQRYGQYCDKADTVWVAKAGLRSPACTYHQRIHLDATGAFRVDSRCASVGDMRHENRFVLPPVQEFYYRLRHPGYHRLPPYHPSCGGAGRESAMQFIYPRDKAKIYIPRDLAGKPGEVVLEVAHRQPAVRIFWYVDREFVGQTQGAHQLPVYLKEGKYTLTITDETGEFLAAEIEILSK
jgi:penicillin-binding protein 1C